MMQTPGLAPRGSGSAEIVAGTYKIYGTEINIQRGRVLFSNSPPDNPGLDIRVAREFSSGSSGNTTVGAQVQGTLQRPRLTLFSDPSMPQSDILSYLVLGRAPQGAAANRRCCSRPPAPWVWAAMRSPRGWQHGWAGHRATRHGNQRKTEPLRKHVADAWQVSHPGSICRIRGRFGQCRQHDLYRTG